MTKRNRHPSVCSIGAIVLLLYSASLAAMTEPEQGYCGLAQQVIAQTELTPKVERPENYEAFVESKALDTPFTVQQFFSNPAPGPESIFRTLSCKMRTSERINTAYAVSAEDPVAVADQSCAQVQQAFLQLAAKAVPPDERQIRLQQFVVEEEQSTFMGPMWLDPWPFNSLEMGEEGELILHSRALYVPWAWWIPLPARFQGNYYCHLMAPGYLELLLRGQASPQS